VRLTADNDDYDDDENNNKNNGTSLLSFYCNIQISYKESDDTRQIAS